MTCPVPASQRRSATAFLLFMASVVALPLTLALASQTVHASAHAPTVDAAP